MIRSLIVVAFVAAVVLATTVPTPAGQLVPLRLHSVLVYQQGALLSALSNHSWTTAGSHDILIPITPSSIKSHRNDQENFQLQIRSINTPAAASARVVRSKTDVVVDPSIQQEIDNVLQEISQLQMQIEDNQDETQRIKDDDRRHLLLQVNTTTTSGSRMRALSLHYYARIRQMTGFDWNNVSIQLSTGSVQRNEVLPTLEPWRLTFTPTSDEGTGRPEATKSKTSGVSKMMHNGVPVSTMMHQATPTFSVNRAGAPQQFDESDEEVSGASSYSSFDGVEAVQQGISDVFILWVWNNVSIQLSTGSVQRNEVLPTLEPWRLTFTPSSDEGTGRAQFTKSKTSGMSKMMHQATMSPQASRSFGGNRAGAPQQFDESDEEVSGASSYSSFDGVEAVQQGISDVFILKGLHTVGQEANPANAVRVPVAVLGFHVNLTALVFPKHSTSAFLRAEFFNDSPLSLLRGKGQAFLDGALLGVVTVPFTGVRSSKCMVDLGTDRTIEVTRHISQASTSDTQTGIFSSTKHRSASRDIIITIENKRSHPVDVIVREVLPQPTHNSIHVNLREPQLSAPLEDILKDPKHFPDGLTMPLGNNATLVKYPGMMEWKRHVAASSRRTIFLSFDVSWSPQDTRNVNLDL
ncbi:membrane-associated protein, putative [Bodo saltans]|uniref:Membrane-associated protein, putative n=1 Tax=Bodo saltans TaxID=75058 RepID=A0A0S4IZN9_BODSA|nr:membrane-associated protein, putative [Bodo saltans]|eukprot:CUG33425.1 membrane-associated protein, putative [Bodo saltans]